MDGCTESCSRSASAHLYTPTTAHTHMPPPARDECQLLGLFSKRKREEEKMDLKEYETSPKAGD